MPQTNRADHATRFLRRSRLITAVGAAVCGTAWINTLCWIGWTQPDILGPARLLGAVALGSGTALCTVLCWHAHVKILERADRILDDARHHAGAPVAAPGRPHIVNTRP